MKLLLAGIVMLSSALTFAQIDLKCDYVKPSSEYGMTAKFSGETILTCFSKNQEEYSVILRKSYFQEPFATQLTFEKTKLSHIRLFCPNYDLPQSAALQDRYSGLLTRKEMVRLQVEKVETTSVGGELRMYKLLGSECQVRGISKFKGRLGIVKGDKDDFGNMLYQ